MEDLTKHQLILLTLLVSFVTSIATGIMTSTLLQEAPIEVTQTINRVVERTIEKVASEEGKSDTPVKEVTTVVKEEDLILSSVEKSARSLVRIKTIGFDGSEITVGIGLVVSADGIVVTDRRNYSGNSSYTILFHDNKTYSTSRIYDDQKSGFVFMKVGKPNSEKYTFYPAKLGPTGTLKLGQSVIVLSGKERNTIAVGRIAELDIAENNELDHIKTDIPTSFKPSVGSPLINLSGEILGLYTPLTDEVFQSFGSARYVEQGLKTAILELAR